MARTLRTILNESNPNKVPAALQSMKAGDAFALTPEFFSGVPATHILVLPAGRKARSILAAFARTGTAAGHKLPITPGATPAAGQCAINPAGDVLFNTVDAVTAAEVVYVTEEGDVVTEELVVTTDLFTPSGSRRAVRVVSATAITGTSTGAKTEVARLATPAAGQCAINGAGQVLFAVADAVTRASVTYIAAPGVGVATPSIGARIAGDVSL